MMPAARDDATIDETIQAIYDAAVKPEGWSPLLAQLSRLFDSHFADVFARTQDRTQFHGLAHGLDRHDYEDEFLGTWVKRNVWGTRRPVEHAGEVVSTRMMMPKEELVRSEMYNEYLAPRGLHEGLRLAIWSGDGWIQDISLLRSWSAGPFDRREIALAEHLLPHLTRAASVARELRSAASIAQSGFAALDSVGAAAFLLATTGQVIRFNVAAGQLLGEADGLLLDDSRLSSPHAASARLMNDAVARGIALRQGATVVLPRPSGAASFTLTIVPMAGERDWMLLRPPALLAVVHGAAPSGAPNAVRLAAMFGLTEAETDIALAMLAGQNASEIAAARGRSVHTVRTHLARLMGKTQTKRQSDLIRVLLGAVPPVRSPGPVFD